MSIPSILLFLFLFSFIIGSLSRDQYCLEHPQNLVCSKTPPTALGPECGSASKKEVGFDSFEQVKIVKAVNDLRVDLTKGEVMLEGVKFPSAGDMVLVQWNIDLRDSAQNYAKLCKMDASDRALRLVENITTEVSEVIYGSYGTEKKTSTQVWEQAFDQWKTGELHKMKPYATTQKKYLHSNPEGFTPILFGKQRYIGCGRVMFYLEDKDTWNYYVVCHLSAADLDNTRFYVKDKKGCEDCPPRTECSKQGSYKDLLCAWSGSQRMVLPFSMTSYLLSSIGLIIANF